MGIQLENYPNAGYVRIAGVNYDYEMFRALGKDGFSVGSIFQLIGRDQAVSIRHRPDLEAVEANRNEISEFGVAAFAGPPADKMIEAAPRYKRGKKWMHERNSITDSTADSGSDDSPSGS